jgi:integrase
MPNYKRKVLKRSRVISTATEERYLLFARQPSRDIVTVMIATGMRPKEVCALRKEDVVIQNASNELSQSFVKIPVQMSLEPYRKVYLGDSVAAILQARIEQSTTPYLFLDLSSMKRWVFYTKSVKNPVAYIYNRLHDQHRLVLAESGVDFDLFDCRCTFAFRAFEAGEDHMFIANMLGDKSVNTFLNYLEQA